MEKTTFVSIVCPIYKAENYLATCIDSVLRQTFQDFELLLIDDGSPDGSGKICDEYAARDSRIKVIHKANGGVSSARQKGVDLSTGEYVIQIDPDDWIEPNTLEIIHDAVISTSADVVIFDFYMDYAQRSVYTPQKPTNTSSSHDMVMDILTQRLHGSVCNKLIKRSLYKGVQFPTILQYSEDAFVCTQIFKRPNIKIIHIDKALYHYNIFENKNSLMRSTSSKKMTEQAEVFISLMLKDFPLEEYKDGYAVQYADLAVKALRSHLYPYKQYKSKIKEWSKKVDFKPYLPPIWKVLINLSLHLNLYDLIHTMIRIKRKL